MFIKTSVRKPFNTGWFFILPAVIVFIIFKYYPITMGIVVSFFDYNIMNPLGEFVGLHNYIRAVKDPHVLNALINNLSFAAIMVCINLFVPLILAIMINEIRKNKGLFRTLYYIPAILPTVVVSVLWKYIWQPDYGLANQIITSIGFKAQLWLNDANLVKVCMRIPYTVILAGLSYGMDFIIYLAALNNIPKEMYESSGIDGASFWQRLRYITLPQLGSTISMLLILDTIYIFNLFDEVMVMTSGGPARASETLVMYAFKKANTDLDYSYAVTITTISFLIVFSLTALQLHLKSKKEG